MKIIIRDYLFIDIWSKFNKVKVKQSNVEVMSIGRNGQVMYMVTNENNVNLNTISALEMYILNNKENRCRLAITIEDTNIHNLIYYKNVGIFDIPENGIVTIPLLKQADNISSETVLRITRFDRGDDYLNISKLKVIS